MPDDTPRISGHSWVRYIIAPVHVYRSEDDGEPHVEYDHNALVEFFKDPDARIGCLICNQPLDTGWDEVCPGPSDNQLQAFLEGMPVVTGLTEIIGDDIDVDEVDPG